jgi:hypothetical protein
LIFLCIYRHTIYSFLDRRQTKKRVVDEYIIIIKKTCSLVTKTFFDYKYNVELAPFFLLHTFCTKCGQQQVLRKIYFTMQFYFFWLFFLLFVFILTLYSHYNLICIFDDDTRLLLLLLFANEQLSQAVFTHLFLLFYVLCS